MKKLIVVSLLSLLPLSIFARVIIEKEIEYYNVYPKTKKDIKNELLQKSPVKKAGRKLYGGTKWKVNTNVRVEANCRIKKAYVDLLITTMLPRLTPGKNVKYSVKSPFNKLKNKLITYQKTHEGYAIKAAKEIEKKLLSYGSPEDCDKARKIRRTDVNNIIKKYREKSKEYDEKTDFGRKKGVKLK